MLNLNRIVLAAVASLTIASSAFASPISFTLTSPTSRSGISDSTYALQYNYNKPGLNMSLTGWTYGVNTTTTTVCDKKDKKGKCTKSHTVTTKAPDKKATQTLVGNFGSSNGLGDEKAATPNHAIDNEGGYYDMLMLSFSSLVTLNTIDLGWISNDSDVSILAFNGTPSQISPAGKSWESLLGDGWVSGGNYYNVGSSPKNVNPLNISSKYWLIGAYNSALDSIVKDTNTDYFKLQTIKVSKVKLPEPATFMLLALGLLGLGAARRKA